MSLIPEADKEAHDRFKFIADWYVDRFEESPSVCFSGFDIQEGSYEHLELLERCYKEKKMIDEFEPVYDDERIY
jgi:hypothetical protein